MYSNLHAAVEEGSGSKLGVKDGESIVGLVCGSEREGRKKDLV